MLAVFKALLAIEKEKADTRKALKLLNKQNWSIEFLQHMLVKAARMYGGALELVIKSPNGAEIIMRSTEAVTGNLKEESIFDKLDDEVAVNEFIAQVQRHRK